MADVEQTCKTCRFWKLFQISIGHRCQVGVCHRFPPTQLKQGPPSYYDFPMTDDWNWCGEWQSKYGTVEVKVSAVDGMSPALEVARESIKEIQSDHLSTMVPWPK